MTEAVLKYQFNDNKIDAIEDHSKCTTTKYFLKMFLHLYSTISDNAFLFIKTNFSF